MKRFFYIGIVSLLLALTGCASSVTKDIHAEAEADPSVKFSAYKSYAWLNNVAVLHDPEGKWQPPNTNLTEELRFLIDRELRKRNLYSYAENPDLAVTFIVGVDMEAMQLKTDPNKKCQILANIPEAALTMALIDDKTEYDVWVGKATGEVSKKSDDATLRKRLDYAVSEMFKKFPAE